MAGTQISAVDALVGSPLRLSSVTHLLSDCDSGIFSKIHYLQTELFVLKTHHIWLAAGPAGHESLVATGKICRSDGRAWLER